MGRECRLFVIVGMLVALLTPLPVAAQQSRGPKILLHVKPVAGGDICAAGDLGCCVDAVAYGGIGSHHVYVLAAPSDAMWDTGMGIGGIQFGLDYAGAYDPVGTGSLICIFSWTLCAALEFPTPSPVWPGPGSGTIITWDRATNCQLAPVAVAGYFYMSAYSQGDLRIIPRPVDGLAKMVTCDLVEHTIEDRLCCETGYLASVRFGGEPIGNYGNPCFPPCPTSPVESSTWSRIKAR